MVSKNEKIAIFDEAGFSHVCSSILEGEGFRAVIMGGADNGAPAAGMDDVALVIASYPCGIPVAQRLRELTLPVIILCDHVGRDIIDLLEGMSHSYCLVKPIDYSRFTSLVRRLMNKDLYSSGGYSLE